MANVLIDSAVSALQDFNASHGRAFSFGDNFSAIDTEFDNFVNHYLFPKINQTTLINVDLGNRFDFLAKEVEAIAQYDEEYVYLDGVPTTMNLSKSEELMLKRNYPKMVTKIYSQGQFKKQKFTLNDNSIRQNFSTIAEAIAYALGVFKKRMSDINVMEERETKAMLVDYSLNHVNGALQRRVVSSEDELFTEAFEAILNLQNNSEHYNESTEASGGTIGRYTTTTKMKNVMILTTDHLKTYLLDTKIANTFNAEGIDLSKRIISFDTLGGAYKLTADVTLAETATITYLDSMGDYQSAIGDIIPVGTVFTYDVSTLTEFVGNVEEIVPTSDLFALIIDVNAIRYLRNTKNMIEEPFRNPEFRETTHWIHYYSSKNVSPFYNKILITGEAEV